MAEPAPKRARRDEESVSSDKKDRAPRNDGSRADRERDQERDARRRKPDHDRRPPRDSDQRSRRDDRFQDRKDRDTRDNRDRRRERSRSRDTQRSRRDEGERKRSRSPRRNDTREDGRRRERSPPRGLRGGPPARDAPRGKPNGLDGSRHANGNTQSSSKAPDLTNGDSEKPQQAIDTKMDLDAMEEYEEEAYMKKIMGFGKFRSTKNTKVPGNDKNYGVRKEKKTEYRQYMNRVGGFNRPLSPSHA